MSEIHINHEAAMRLAIIGANTGNLTPHCKVSRAYLDLHAQLAAERARVEALCDVIYDPNGIAYPFAEMQDKMTAILNAHAQGDEQ